MSERPNRTVGPGTVVAVTTLTVLATVIAGVPVGVASGTGASSETGFGAAASTIETGTPTGSAAVPLEDVSRVRADADRPTSITGRSVGDTVATRDVRTNGSEGAAVGATATEAAGGVGGWRSVHADAANTGHNPTATSAPALRFRESWRIENVSPRQPAVADGRVYTAVRPAAGEAGQPLVVDAGDGDPLVTANRTDWRLKSLTVANGRVFATRAVDSDFGGTYGRVVALNAGSAAVRWNRGLGLRRYVEGVKSVNGTVYARGDLAGDELVAADADTGEVRWRLSDIYGSPAIAAGMVYTNDGYFGTASLVARTTADGDQQWNGSQLVLTAPAVADGTVYTVVQNSSGDSVVRAYDASDGTVRWSTSVGAVLDGLGSRERRLAVAGDRVVVTGNNGGPSVRVFDAATGDRVWGRDLSGVATVTQPTVADGTVYVGSMGAGEFGSPAAGGKLHTFDLQTGGRLGTWAPEVGVAAPPAVAGDTVYVTTARVNAVDNVRPDDLVALTGLDDPPTPDSEDVWRQYRGGPGHAGATADARGPTDGVEVAWNRSPFGVRNPAVANGTFYASGVAYDVWTGETVSERGPSFDVNDDPTVVDRRPTGQLRVIGDGRSEALASPPIVDRVVYRARTERVSDGSGITSRYTSTVSARLATTGETVWTRSLPGSNATAGRPLTVTNGTVVIVTARDWLFGLNATDGTIRWRTDAISVSEGPTPAAGNGSVYFTGGGGGSLEAIDVRTGTRRSVADLSNGRINDASQVVFRNGLVYLRESRFESGGVVAVDPATGERAWRFDPGEFGGREESPARAAPAVTDDVLVTPGPDGDLYGLDPATGERLWRYAELKRSWDHLTVAQGVVVAVDVREDGDTRTIGLRGTGVDPPQDEPPSVRIETSPTTPTSGESVALRAAVSGVGEVGAVEWRFSDGSVATGRRVLHAFPGVGSYEVGVRVVTAEGPNVTADRTVEVVPTNASGPVILNVTTTPSAPVPAVDGGRKLVRAAVYAPDRLQRVEFHVTNGSATETYTDSDPSGGWSVIVPTDRWAGNATVQVEAVGSLGGRDRASAGLGVYDVGPILEAVIEGSGEALVVDAVSQEQSITIPPGGPISAGGSVPTPAGPVGVEVTDLAFETGATVSYLPPGLEPFGSVRGELGVLVVKGTVDGRVAGVIEPVVTPDGITMRVRLFRGRLDAALGVYRDFPVPTPAGEIEPEVFDGAFLTSDGIVWDDPEAFPRPTDAPVFAGKRVRGSFTSPAAEVEIVGQYGGESTYPEFENFSLRGQVVATGVADLPIGEVTFENVLFDESVRVADANTDTTRTTTRLPTRRTAVPFPNASFDTRGPVPAAAGRLTDDGLADRAPTLTATRDGYLLAWERQASNRTVREGHDVFVRRADPSTNWSAPVRVTDDRRVDLDPAVAARGNGSGAGGDRLLAWTRSTRSFATDADANGTVPDPDAVYGSLEVAVSVANESAPDDWSAPVTVTNGSGSATAPRVVAADGQYLLAWRTDADGNWTTRDDRGVAYAPYVPTDGLGPVTTVPGATSPRVAGESGDGTGLRVAFLKNATAGATGNATVVVRNLTAETERRLDTSDPEELALSTRSVAWTTGVGRNTAIRYAAGTGPVREVSTGGVAAVEDLSVTTRRAPSGTVTETVTYRGRPLARAPGTNRSRPPTPGAYLRVRRGDNWTPPRRITPTPDAEAGTAPSRETTLAAPAVAGRERGVVTVATARGVNRSPAEARNRELVFVRHDYGTDLNVSVTADPTSVDPGDSVTLAWRVRNEGGLPARDIRLNLTDETGRIRTVTPAAGPVAPGANVSGSVTFTADASRRVTLAASAAGQKLAPANDEATTILMRPTLNVTGVTPRPLGEDGGRTHAITVRNDGPVAASNLTAAVIAGQETRTSRSVGTLPSGASRSVEVDAGGVGVATPATVRVSPRPTASGSPATVTRRLPPALPDLSVAAAGVRTGPAATCGVGTVACVTVGNRGRAPANTTVTVRPAGNDGSGSASTTVTLPAAGPGSAAYRTVAVDVGDLDPAVGDRVTVRASASTLDADPADNVASHRVERLDPFADGETVVGDTAPTDPDADGRYEDVDGDGSETFADVVALFERLDRPPVTTHPRAFDFNDNGRVDFADLIELFEAV